MVGNACIWLARPAEACQGRLQHWKTTCMMISHHGSAGRSCKSLWQSKASYKVFQVYWDLQQGHESWLPLLSSKASKELIQSTWYTCVQLSQATPSEPFLSSAPRQIAHSVLPRCKADAITVSLHTQGQQSILICGQDTLL